MRLIGRHRIAGVAVLCLLGTASALPAAGPAPEPGATPPTVHAPLSNSPTIHGLERAQRRPDGALVVPGQLSGTGSVKAKHLIIEGELSPGHSPGCIDFAGDVALTAMATLLIEIGGSIPCTGYDKVSVAGTLTLYGATLEVALVNGFVPQYGDQFDVLDWGSLTGSFGSIDTTAATLPVPLLWDTSQLYLTGELRVDVQHFADGDLAPWDDPDGNINAADVLIATQLVLGQHIPGALQYAHGDMNADGSIDLADLLLIEQTVFQ